MSYTNRADYAEDGHECKLSETCQLIDDHGGDCDARTEQERWAALHTELADAAERCPSCLMSGFESLTRACAFCGISGCDLCIYDGDLMYNAPTCCAEAAQMHEAWWTMPATERYRFPRGCVSDETTVDEARAILARMI